MFLCFSRLYTLIWHDKKRPTTQRISERKRRVIHKLFKARVFSKNQRHRPYVDAERTLFLDLQRKIWRSQFIISWNLTINIIYKWIMHSILESTFLDLLLKLFKLCSIFRQRLHIKFHLDNTELLRCWFLFLFVLQ